MTNRLLRYDDLMELYGFSEYQARKLMQHIPKYNISNGSMRPRWVVKQEDVDNYLLKRKQRNDITGLDKFGKILRKR